VGIAGVLRQAQALQGAAAKGLGTLAHFLRTGKGSPRVAAEFRRDFAKLRVFRNDQPGRGRALSTALP
jgi:hypothetical protein